MKAVLRIVGGALIVVCVWLGSSGAQGLPYSEGSVWQITFVRTRANRGDDYLKSLRASWQVTLEEAKKRGIIVSYRVFSGDAANKDDWDTLLAVEYPNMAALDGADEAFFGIRERVLGSEDKQRQSALKRDELRDIVGTKLVRELVLK